MLVFGTLVALSLFTARGRSAGQADTPVTLGVFEEAFLPEPHSTYIGPGRAKLVWLNFPFRADSARLPVDDSKLAAQAAECAYLQGAVTPTSG